MRGGICIRTIEANRIAQIGSNFSPGSSKTSWWHCRLAHIRSQKQLHGRICTSSNPIERPWLLLLSPVMSMYSMIYMKTRYFLARCTPQVQAQWFPTYTSCSFSLGCTLLRTMPAEAYFGSSGLDVSVVMLPPSKITICWCSYTVQIQRQPIPPQQQWQMRQYYLELD